MTIHLRPITPADTENCGRIIFEAFKGIADQHNFRPDFPSVEFATQFAGAFINSPTTFGVAAELDGVFVGSNFLSEDDAIRGVGPITIDPGCQARGIGRKLMQAVIDRGRDAIGIRLVQDAFNTASMSLYTSLGFDIKEPLVMIEGQIQADLPAGVEVRRLAADDFDACGDLCRSVHGIERTNELRHMPPMFPSFAAFRNGRLVAYTSAPHFWPLNHGVAETTEDMQALLIGASQSVPQPLSFLIPIRQSALFRWCLGHGMRVIKPMNLMAMGEYQEPRGCFLPSVGY